MRQASHLMSLRLNERLRAPEAIQRRWLEQLPTTLQELAHVGLARLSRPVGEQRLICWHATSRCFRAQSSSGGAQEVGILTANPLLELSLLSPASSLQVKSESISEVAAIHVLRPQDLRDAGVSRLHLSARKAMTTAPAKAREIEELARLCAGRVALEMARARDEGMTMSASETLTAHDLALVTPEFEHWIRGGLISDAARHFHEVVRQERLWRSGIALETASGAA